MTAGVTATSRLGRTVGPTSEFSLFFRVRPGHAEALRAALRDLQDTPGYRPGDYDVAIATIHEARFVLFDDTRLAFVTSFDGPWNAYMEDFFTSGPTLALFDVIFRHTEGYEGLPDRTALRSFADVVPDGRLSGARRRTSRRKRRRYRVTAFSTSSSSSRWRKEAGSPPRGARRCWASDRRETGSGRRPTGSQVGQMAGGDSPGGSGSGGPLRRRTQPEPPPGGLFRGA